MDVLEAVRTRRSVGKLDGDVSEAEIRELIEAATWAPNHKLTEPWTFTVLRGEARARLGAAWARLAEIETSLTGEERATFVRREGDKPLRAPVLIVVSTRTDADAVVAAEDFAATAAAVQNLLLAAWAKGLGAMWRTGPLAYRRAINEHLGLDPSDRIVAVVYLGRMAMNPPKGRSRQTETVVRWLS